MDTVAVPHQRSAIPNLGTQGPVTKAMMSAQWAGDVDWTRRATGGQLQAHASGRQGGQGLGGVAHAPALKTAQGKVKHFPVLSRTILPPDAI
jgi:hypothetical protein